MGKIRLWLLRNLQIYNSSVDSRPRHCYSVLDISISREARAMRSSTAPWCDAACRLANLPCSVAAGKAPGSCALA